MGERAVKRRRLSPRSEVPTDRPPRDAEPQSLADTAFGKNASRWNLEQDYERRPRKKKNEKENTRLPIKTAEGRVEHLQISDAQDDSATFEELAQEAANAKVKEDEVKPDEPRIPIRQQVVEAKEELARIAALVNEDPEEHIRSLKTLTNITSSRVPTITKLGLATQLSVYKDVIPGYRIRPVSEEDMKAKLSKDVRKMRNFEQSIVRGYQKYVQELSRIAALRKADSSEVTASMSRVAVSCACNLLTSVPHFNFRSELLKIMVSKVSGKSSSPDFGSCCEALRKLFEEDEDGNASLEAVSMLARMIKAKNYHIDEGVLNLFLHLRLLAEFHSKASITKVDKTDDSSQPMGKKPKQKREFRTKRERKVRKEQKGIEEEMKEADAQVSYEQRDKIQAETLKLVFGVYFRILKARTQHLMGPVLEGLVKYAHLINQDFFGDLLESLKDLIRDTEASLDKDEETDQPPEDSTTTRNTTRESLLCVTTAFALLQGQDASASASALSLDLSFFITHLYRTLHPLSLNPDIELSSKSLQLPDPASPSASHTPTRTKVNIQTTIVLLLRSLTAVLLPPNSRSTPPLRLAAFSKQLMTTSLHLPEKSATATLGLLNQVSKAHKQRIGSLWRTEERRGDGVFDGTAGEVEAANPFAGTVWEGELLRVHYAAGVREGVRNLEAAVMGD